MKLRHTRSEPAGLDLTPLIDVVFLLLIFFMVSTTFKKEAELTIELPEATTDARQETVNPIEIAIDATGRYFINQQEVVDGRLDTLMRAIRKMAGNRKDPPLIISADAKTPHQAVVTAMDAARSLGFVHLTFAIQKSPDAAE